MSEPNYQPGPTREEPFRLLVESISDYAIFALDPAGNVLTWNGGAQRLHGYIADEIVGRHFSCFYLEDEKATAAMRQLKEAATQGRIQVEDWRVRRDGSRFWAAVVITAMCGPSGQLAGFANVTRDLGASPGAEDQLRVSEEQFRRLVESVDEYAIYMLDPQGNVATWNSGAQRIKQYQAQDIIGKNFACFYTADEVAHGTPERNLQDAARLGHVRVQGLRVRQDGTPFHADITITALRDGSGQLLGFSKVTRDITDQLLNRETEAAKLAAEKANQAKDDFLAALSHELRTPLTPALAAAGFLAHNASRIPAEFKDEVAIIRRNVQLEARLIDDLLDLTRIIRGRIELHFDRVDARAIVRQALSIVEPDSAQKRLKITNVCAARENHVWADPIRLQQVFWNVLNNAVQFTPPGGSIEIRTANDESGRFVLEVTDTGIGIDIAFQQLLFKPFEQGDRSVTRQFGGLGLGLAISKLLMDLHEGHIEVESGGRSKGATFRMVMPVMARQSSHETTPTKVMSRPNKSLRILLVEDHVDTRRTLSRLLTHFGHQISEAECTQQALEIMEAKEFDVVLSDIGLPDGTGYEVIAQAKRKRPVMGVALTGFGTEEDVRRGREAGFDFHLTKPVDFHELRTVLEQASI